MESPEILSEEQPSMRRFYTVWGGQAVSLFGSLLVQFALVWYLTEETGSAVMLTMATLMALLPQAILGPFVGALIDRWNRRRVMLVADSAIALVTLLLALDFALGTIEPWHILVLMFFRAVGSGFHQPAMMASTSLMVPEEQLTRVSGMNQILMGGLNIIAPPLGALLLGVMPMQGILMIDVVTALVAIIPLLFIPIPQPKRKAEKTTVLADMLEGFRYVWEWPGLLILLLMATLINLVGTPAAALLPILVSGYFGGSEGQYALVQTMFSLGILFGGLTLSIWGGFKRRVYTSTLGIFLMGLSMLVMGILPPEAFTMAVIVTLTTGLTNSLVNGPLMAIFQATIAPEMQGRVFTLITSIAIAATPIGLIIAGPLAEIYGVQLWYIIAGIMCFLMGIGMVGIPAVRNLEDKNNVNNSKEGQPIPDPAAEGVV